MSYFSVHLIYGRKETMKTEISTGLASGPIIFNKTENNF